MRWRPSVTVADGLPLSRMATRSGRVAVTAWVLPSCGFTVRRMVPMSAVVPSSDTAVRAGSATS